MTDDQLDELVAAVQQQFPNWGNRQMYGHLLSRGIGVPFSRVCESQSRVDPDRGVYVTKVEKSAKTDVLCAGASTPMAH